MYLVFGSTGNIGGEVVNLLLEQGHDVRVLVRDASRAKQLPDGIEIAVGDLEDLESITNAARGVRAVFYMQVEPVPAQAELMVQAARTAEVNKLVVLSSIGTVLEPLPLIGAGIAARDKVFRESGLDVTYLRANTLMSNALWWLPGLKAAGHVVDGSDPGLTAPVDPYDVARIAVLALTQDGHAGHGYILNGPQALSVRQQVEILADVLGRSIEFVAVTPEEFSRSAVEHGMLDEHMATAMQNLNELFRANRAAVLADDIENLTGTAPRTFRQWCEQHAAAFH